MSAEDATAKACRTHVVPIAPPRVTFDGVDWRLDGEIINGEDLLYVPRATWPTVAGEAGSVVRLARDVIAAAWAQQAYSADFWQAGGAPVLYISTDQPLTNDQAAGISDAWAARRNTHPASPRSWAVAARSRRSAQTCRSEGIRRGPAGPRHCAVPGRAGVDRERAHAAGSLVYQNAGAAGLDLVRYNLQPGYSGPIGDAWSEFLPGGYLTGRRVHIGLEHLTRGTQLEQAQMYQIATGQGVDAAVRST